MALISKIDSYTHKNLICDIEDKLGKISKIRDKGTKEMRMMREEMITTEIH